MSHVTVIVPPSLRRFVGGRPQMAVEASTVREALDGFIAASAGLRDTLFDQHDGLRRFVRVFVDGRPATVRPGDEQAIGDGAQMTILLALAGG